MSSAYNALVAQLVKMETSIQNAVTSRNIVASFPVLSANQAQLYAIAEALDSASSALWVERASFVHTALLQVREHMEGNLSEDRLYGRLLKLLRNFQGQPVAPAAGGMAASSSHSALAPSPAPAAHSASPGVVPLVSAVPRAIDSPTVSHPPAPSSAPLAVPPLAARTATATAVLPNTRPPSSATSPGAATGSLPPAPAPIPAAAASVTASSAPPAVADVSSSTAVPAPPAALPVQRPGVGPARPRPRPLKRKADVVDSDDEQEDPAPPVAKPKTKGKQKANAPASENDDEAPAAEAKQKGKGKSKAYHPAPSNDAQHAAAPPPPKQTTKGKGKAPPPAANGADDDATPPPAPPKNKGKGKAKGPPPAANDDDDDATPAPAPSKNRGKGKAKAPPPPPTNDGDDDEDDEDDEIEEISPPKPINKGKGKAKAMSGDEGQSPAPAARATKKLPAKVKGKKSDEANEATLSEPDTKNHPQEEKRTSRPRPPPIPTDETYAIPCDRCQDKNLDCVRPLNGGACVNCKTSKYACRHKLTHEQLGDRFRGPKRRKTHHRPSALEQDGAEDDGRYIEVSDDEPDTATMAASSSHTTSHAAPVAGPSRLPDAPAPSDRSRTSRRGSARERMESRLDTMERMMHTMERRMELMLQGVDTLDGRWARLEFGISQAMMRTERLLWQMAERQGIPIPAQVAYYLARTAPPADVDPAPASDPRSATSSRPSVPGATGSRQPQDSGRPNDAGRSSAGGSSTASASSPPAALHPHAASSTTAIDILTITPAATSASAASSIDPTASSEPAATIPPSATPAITSTPAETSTPAAMTTLPATATPAASCTPPPPSTAAVASTRRQDTGPTGHDASSASGVATDADPAQVNSAEGGVDVASHPPAVTSTAPAISVVSGDAPNTQYVDGALVTDRPPTTTITRRELTEDEEPADVNTALPLPTSPVDLPPAAAPLANTRPDSPALDQPSDGDTGAAPAAASADDTLAGAHTRRDVTVNAGSLAAPDVTPAASAVAPMLSTWGGVAPTASVDSLPDDNGAGTSQAAVTPAVALIPPTPTSSQEPDQVAPVRLLVPPQQLRRSPRGGRSRSPTPAYVPAPSPNKRKGAEQPSHSAKRSRQE